MKPTILALSLLALTGGCGHNVSHHSEAHSSIDSDAGGVTIREEGVTIVAVDVPYRSRSSTVNGRTSGQRAMLGHPFGVSDGKFFIGPINYGPAPEGCEVRVALDGVTIDGERRGDVPPIETGTLMEEE
jgi:hypothetical protein